MDNKSVDKTLSEMFGEEISETEVQKAISGAKEKAEKMLAKNK